MTDAKISKAIRAAVREGIFKAIGRLREKLKKLDAADVVDRILEDIIPEEISRDKRFALKDQIKKRLKEDGTIR
ncbi:MAG: hypothetical protein WBC70_14610 [Candidatus Aminicenantales bacterium]